MFENKIAICFFIIYLVFVGYLIFKKKRPVYFLLGVFTIFIISLPTFNSFIPYAIDVPFHIGREAGIAQTIKDGYFPQRILTWVRNSYGWATGIMYPQLFLYIPALFIILSNSFDKINLLCCNNAFILLVNIATFEIVYYVITKIFEDKKTAVLCGMISLLMQYRLFIINYVGRYGEMLAIMSIPIFVYGLYCVFTNEKNKWYLITIGATFILGSHLITTMLIAVLTIIVMILLFKLITSKETLMSLIKGFGFSLLINLSFIIPLYDFMNEKGIVSTSYGTDIGIASINGGGY